MSGTVFLPDGISISQIVPDLQVTIVPAPYGPVLPPGVPPYPLSSDPSQDWSLQIVGGVLAWVQFAAPPGQAALLLEDGMGALLLEDGAGTLLMEP